MPVPFEVVFITVKIVFMEREPITAVPLLFRKNGYQYEQIFRQGNVAIYMQKNLQGKSTYYEVWVIRVQETRTIMDAILPRREKPPGNEDWGKFGFSFYTVPGAQKKAEQLLRQDKDRKRTGAGGA